MLVEKLIKYIAKNYLDDEESLIEQDTQLIALNIIDSSSIFDLVDYIKSEESDVDISMMDIHPANFASINNIVELVNRLKGDAS